jgi:hypothetical protein
MLLLMNWFKIKDIKYEQTVFIIGPKDIKAVVSEQKKIIRFLQFAIATALKEFQQKNKQKIKFFCWLWYGPLKQDGYTDKYDAKQNTLVTVFNNYFGGGMGSIVKLLEKVKP